MTVEDAPGVWPPVDKRGLPRGVAKAGDQAGRRYLFRPGELLVDERELERDDLGLRLDDLGARRLDAPRRRKPRCRAQEDPCGDRREERERQSQADRARSLERNGFALFRLPPDGPGVPDVVDQLRVTRDGCRPNLPRVFPNTVLTGEQFPEFGPADDAERTKLPDRPEGDVGRGVRVGVVDTGMRSDHSWLEGRAETRGAVDGEELDENDDDLLDPEAGHGTFVAGCVLSVAPGATIVGRCTMDSLGVTEDAWVASSIETLRGHCIDILNLSLGGFVVDDEPYGLPLTAKAIADLRYENPEMVVTAAAGNRHSADPFYPAALPGVIGVGALDHTGERAWFSNRGRWVNAWSLGVDIVSCYVGTDLDLPGGGPAGAKDGARWSGTSFAAPRVAGALAATMRS